MPLLSFIFGRRCWIETVLVINRLFNYDFEWRLPSSKTFKKIRELKLCQENAIEVGYIKEES